MTETADRALEAIARRTVDDPVHYLDALSQMSASREVRAADDITSASGIKLVARGARIDARRRAKLAGHRLAPAALENGLAVADGVTPALLAVDVMRLLGEDPWLRRLAARSGDPAAIRHGVARLTLPRPVLVRLTVAREQRPGLYRHLLAVSVIGHCLALRAGLKPALVDSVLVAALCHDLGELHTDPAILEPGHRVTDEELRFIYAHPVTGWLILREVRGLDPEVARAVLQHHERLDGSGYPHGRRGDAIGVAGRILAAADVAEAIMRRFGDHARLSTLLRLNHRKYDRQLVGPLHEADAGDAPAPSAFAREALARRLSGFAALLDGWSALRGEAALAHSAPGAFVSERLFNLRTVVLQAGFDPDSLEMLLCLAQEDATIAAELTAVFDELQFQLAELGREFDRRAPQWQAEADRAAAAALGAWRRQVAGCVAR